MEKPYAVMERHRLETTEGEKQETEYIVRAIVTKKLVFKIRPKPIIANLD
jgi:hypothetical protein